MYDPVSIQNMTPFHADGKVEYASMWCSNDGYGVNSGETWKAGSRGACLVTRISAVVRTRGGDVWAQPYESSGTGYSTFAIVVTGTDSFMVTRLSYSDTDAPPAGHVEPTEQQK